MAVDELELLSDFDELEPELSDFEESDFFSDELDDELFGAALRGPVGRALGRLAAVGAVEAAALEDHAHLAEQLAQTALALGALGQRVVAEGLHRVELVVALGARIGIGRHEKPSVMV